MEQATTAAQGLHAAGESAGYDAACKRLLSEKAILARIMKGCLEEYRDCDVNDIAEKYIEGTPQISRVPVHPDEAGAPLISGMNTEDKTVLEGTVTYDIRFYAIVPGQGERVRIIINLEAQADFYPGYPPVTRGVYYCCRLISSQYGREFTGSQYQKLKKVYSIWICTNPPKERENVITRYRLAEEHLAGSFKEPAAHYDLLSVIMLCLGEAEAENRGGILRLLDVLFTSTASEAEKRQILEEEYRIPMTRTMTEGVTEMCNLSKGVLERGIEQGLKQGLEQGLERGLEKGVVMTSLKAIRNMMQNLELSAEQAMNVLEIPEAERQKYRELLELG